MQLVSFLGSNTILQCITLKVTFPKNIGKN